MRIVLDAQPLQWRQTGIATYVWCLLKHLARLDTTNEYRCFLSQRLRARTPPELPALDGVAISPLVTRVPRRLLYRTWGSDLSRMWPMETLAGPFDVFHYTDHLCAFQARGASVMTVYDLSVLRVPQWHPLGRRIALSASRIRWSLKHATMILAISEFTKREVMELFEIDPSKIVVTPLGVESTRWAAGPAPLSREELLRRGMNRPFILCVATLEPRKNLAGLIRAYASVKRRLRLPHRLVLIGGRGWCWEHIVRTVSALGLDEDVWFADYVPRPEVPRWMASADLFVYPSFYEGFGLPPLEAMACGAPTIVSNTSALPEVVGEAALLVDPYDVESIAEAMGRALTDEALRRTLSQRGRARARRFSWERTARATLDAYRAASRLVGEQHRAGR